MCTCRFQTGVIILIVLTWLPRGASGDCGGIPFKTHVQVFEPDQRAVIAYNGREEILLLSTDLRASEPTKHGSRTTCARPAWTIPRSLSR
jgi:hypothetical protein